MAKLLCLPILALLVLSKTARADGDRPAHFLLQSGIYGALGSPASWGPTLSLDVLPGSIFERWGVRGEYRGYEGYGEGSILAGAIFEAGASRPQLALKLVMEAGLTADNAPIIGAGVEWSLWALGPVGVSTITDLTIIIDGSDTRPALSGTLSLHLGR